MNMVKFFSRKAIPVLGVMVLAPLLVGCQDKAGMNNSPPAASQAIGQQEVLAAQARQDRKVEVTCSARVLKMLPDDTRGLPHELFLLRLDNGTTVKVAHDTKLAPRVPLQEGDLVTLRGEYIWNEKGGVIHWTHHSPNGRHEGGWIEFNGQRYQ
jgi:hypothetical protein